MSFFRCFSLVEFLDVCIFYLKIICIKRIIFLSLDSLVYGIIKNENMVIVLSFEVLGYFVI